MLAQGITNQFAGLGTGNGLVQTARKRLDTGFGPALQVHLKNVLLDGGGQLIVVFNTLQAGSQHNRKCKVRIDIQSGSANVSEWQASEEKFVNARERADGYRLACATKLIGDVVAFVPEESRMGRQVIRKEASDIEIVLNPAAKLYYVELSKPSLEEPLGDFERLAQKMGEIYGLQNPVIDHFALVGLPDLLRKADWKVTVTVWQNREIIRIQPGYVEDYWGLAVDLGTTTVAAYLCSLRTGSVDDTESMMNPQVTYGEDVMSRITHSLANAGEGLKKLNTLIADGINTMIVELTQRAGIGREDIVDMSLVGNTAMHHIFLGINPHFIGVAPFAPAIHHSIDIKARDLGIGINRCAYIHVLPIEAGFVGADNVGVLICEEPYRKDEIQLIIDIGTNGELLLGNRERILSSSCATGPALEGAQITFGMRAATGAIERIKIDPETLEVNYRIIGNEGWSQSHSPGEVKAKGICGSGILDVLGELYRTGIVQKNGAFNRNLNTPRFRNDGDGRPEFVVAWKEETSIDRDVVITQGDIRQIQLAKAAIYTGAKLMMRRLGIDQIDRVVIAGAFGSYVDREEALIIGMFPDISLEKIFAVGNAAGDGARIALLNKEKRDEANRIAREVEYIELTLEEGFQDEFVAALHIPHTRDPFPHLRGIVPDEILDQ